jgi:hypothetical protein
MLDGYRGRGRGAQAQGRGPGVAGPSNPILSKIPEVKIECSLPKIVYERRYEYVKISEDELYGRIIRLALEGFFDECRNDSDVAMGLLRG